MLQTLVLSVTFKCPIVCRYCGVHAGPHRKTRMSLEFITRVIDESYSFGVLELVVFTGGEPFLLGKDLYSAVDYAAKKGLKTRIVTSAYWATSPERAYQTLRRLNDHGLTEINYSCDDFHQEYVPLERIKWANEAASKVGLPALIACKGLANSRITPQYLEEYFGTELTRFKPGQKNPKNNVISYGVTVPVGWQSQLLVDEDLLWNENLDCWKTLCSSVLERIVITPQGKVAICCGIGSNEIPETIVGDVNDKPLLEILMSANKDLIVNWLALEGPYGIMRFVQDRRPEIKFRDRYVNICHLCHDIFTNNEVRTLLQSLASEKAPTLSLKRAWLESHRSEIFGNIAS
jgi:hypothetical protein